jgi:membrane peptidoglycan carboxypeptidase
LEGDRTRGASSITQQLLKNLFFGTAAPSSARAQRLHWYWWANSSSGSSAF